MTLRGCHPGQLSTSGTTLRWQNLVTLLDVDAQVWGGVGCCISLILLALGDAQRSIPLLLFAMCTFLFAFSASYGVPS